MPLSLSPLNVEHILVQILLFVDVGTLPLCLCVCKSWYIAAAPISWEICYFGHIKNQPPRPPWPYLISNLRHIRTFYWSPACSRYDRKIQERDLCSAFIKIRNGLHPGEFGRLREINIYAHRDIKRTLKILLPFVPYIRKLSFSPRINSPQYSDIDIPLDIIGENLPRLHELHLNSRIFRFTSDNMIFEGDTITPFLNLLRPNMAFKDLKMIDFGGGGISAQLLMDIAPLFPKLEFLGVNQEVLMESIAKYTSKHCRHHTVSPSNDFARDLSSSLLNLQTLKLNACWYTPHSQRSLELEYLKDITIAFESRLRIIFKV